MRSKIISQILCCFFSNMRNSKSIQEPPKRLFFGSFYLSNEFRNCFFSNIWKFTKKNLILNTRELVNICDRIQNFLFNQNLNHRLTNPTNIHRISRHKMHNFFLNLSRAKWIGTIIMNIHICNWFPTFRTKKWRDNRFFRSISTIRNTSQNIRDYLTTPLHPNKISLLNLLIGDKIKIMKTDSRDRCPTELDRFNMSNWSDDPCSSYLESHRIDLRCYLLCWKFISNCSPRMMFCSSQQRTDSLKMKTFFCFRLFKRK